jgi:glyoxylase-like metal-dependent hydrolase (beta-lactamase superfamily II)
MDTPRQVSLPAETRAPGGRSHAYLLDGLLVDPATPSTALEAAVRDAGADHVAVTHHHPDHVGGVADCAATLGLTVWARAGRERAFAEATGVAPDRTYRPGESLPVGDGVPVLDTPGHAPEHVAFGAGDGLVTGDLAVAEGSVVVGAPEGDVRAYLTSLRRVHARAPDRLYPAHGPGITDPRATCRRLLSHRLDRERRVAAAVRSGARTPDAVLEAAYAKDLSGVRDLARATVVAHLEKLSVERRVRWDGEHARPA